MGRAELFPSVDDDDWESWQWQVSNRITSIKQLTKYLNVEVDESMPKLFRMAITPYVLSLIDTNNPHDPILKQFVPSNLEAVNCGHQDPLAEDQSNILGLTHRYPDRVLLTVSNLCSSYCRYCTRKRHMSEEHPSKENFSKMIGYIKQNKQIRDVLVSGGDPFLLPTHLLKEILTEIRAISHVEIIRIGTRTPSVLPQRITAELCEVLASIHPLWVNVHFSHPNECTKEAYEACAKLSSAGVPLNCQTVLLKGINDDIDTMRKLVHHLLKMRVRPYYLYLCDPVVGTKHFRTTINKGLEIIEGLRGHTSGLAVPNFVIDSAKGKALVMPQYLVSQENSKIILRNYLNETYEYIDY